MSESNREPSAERLEFERILSEYDDACYENETVRGEVPSNNDLIAASNALVSQHRRDVTDLFASLRRERDAFKAERDEARAQLAHRTSVGEERDAALARCAALSAQVAALHHALSWVQRWRKSPEGEASVPVGRWPWEMIAQASVDSVAAAAAHEAAIIEKCATFVERDFDHGKHEVLCPHPEEPCTCLLGEVAAAIRALAAAAPEGGNPTAIPPPEGKESTP